MDNTYAILRVKKLKNWGAVSGSAQHAFRERYTPNADPARIGDNEILAGARSDQELREAIRKRLEGVQTRSDSVPCLEYLVTASPKAFELLTLVSEASLDEYFKQSLNWIRERHGADNVMSAVIHRDETTPHMSVFVTPVVHREASTRKRSVSLPGGGREVREFVTPAHDVLCAKEFVGGRAKLQAMQTEFAQQVGANNMMERGKQRAVGEKRRTHKEVREWYAELPKVQAQLARQQAALDAAAADLLARRQRLDAEAEQLRQQREQFVVDQQQMADRGRELEYRTAALQSKERKIAEQAELVKTEQARLSEVAEKNTIERATIEVRINDLQIQEYRLRERQKRLETVKSELVEIHTLIETDLPRAVEQYQAFTARQAAARKGRGR